MAARPEAHLAYSTRRPSVAEARAGVPYGRHVVGEAVGPRRSSATSATSATSAGSDGLRVDPLVQLKPETAARVPRNSNLRPLNQPRMSGGPPRSITHVSTGATPRSRRAEPVGVPPLHRGSTRSSGEFTPITTTHSLGMPAGEPDPAVEVSGSPLHQGSPSEPTLNPSSPNRFEFPSKDMLAEQIREHVRHHVDDHWNNQARDELHNQIMADVHSHAQRAAQEAAREHALIAAQEYHQNAKVDGDYEDRARRVFQPEIENLRKDVQAAMEDLHQKHHHSQQRHEELLAAHQAGAGAHAPAHAPALPEGYERHHATTQEHAERLQVLESHIHEARQHNRDLQARLEEAHEARRKEIEGLHQHHADQLGQLRAEFHAKHQELFDRHQQMHEHHQAQLAELMEKHHQTRDLHVAPHSEHPLETYDGHLGTTGEPRAMQETMHNNQLLIHGALTHTDDSHVQNLEKRHDEKFTDHEQRHQEAFRRIEMLEAQLQQAHAHRTPTSPTSPHGLMSGDGVEHNPQMQQNRVAMIQEALGHQGLGHEDLNYAQDTAGFQDTPEVPHATSGISILDDPESLKQIMPIRVTLIKYAIGSEGKALQTAVTFPRKRNSVPTYLKPGAMNPDIFRSDFQSRRRTLVAEALKQKQDEVWEKNSAGYGNMFRSTRTRAQTAA